MKKIKELVTQIDNLDLPQGNVFLPNTKEWVRLSLKIALDCENECKNGVENEDYEDMLKEWNEFFEEHSKNIENTSNFFDIDEPLFVVKKVDLPDPFNGTCNVNEELPTEFLYDSGFGVHKVTLEVDFGFIPDFMGIKRRIVYLALKEDGESYATISKYFGEWIAMRGAFYADTNNLPNLEEFLIRNHIAIKTSFKKHCGWCEYPLFIVNPKLLEKHPDWNAYLNDFFENICDQEIDLEKATKDMTNVFYEKLTVTLENK